ncbi:MAG: indolepyruvate ferredoxin oxidoreductase subunit alpha [Lachnospiraceae bacterium]|nr:indolepyruvate ferredoxin oxidoreductase subunit alpha [Lachnospiraceae bacterium]
MSEKMMLLGNAALARGAWEAGVKVSSAYPGTPSTEVSEELVKLPDVYVEWAPNEKVATEVAIGASISGVRSMAVMKHVGFNVAADPTYTASYTGVNGGMVMIVADDPGLYSSQNEQDTRRIARAAILPVLEPSDSQEAKDYMKAAFEISERFDTPVVVRTTTRLAHSQTMVECEDRVVPEDKPYERNIAKFVMMPAMAKNRHLVVEQRMKDLAEFAETSPLNTVQYGPMELDGKKVGFITEGIPYQYVKEVCPDASILKLGMVNPLPEKLIREFASKVDTLYIFEELEPVVEEQVRAMGIRCFGKDVFTIQGEYSANMLRERVLHETGAVMPAGSAPARPPILCPGCPHRAVFSVMAKLKLHAAGDIGCYTLGAQAPLSVIDTTICMGASISSLHGMEKAKGHDYIKNWVAVIGDSTFMHTGINSLVNMVYNQSHGTVVILDNRTTGMTGHQDHAGTGRTLMGEEVPAVDFTSLCRGIGVKNVITVDSFDIAQVERVLREETARDELSVIIMRYPCALLKGQKFPYKCVALPEKCKHCGACLRPGCPALTKNEDGSIFIDETMCNGCGLCMSLCKFDAIRKEER